MGEILMKERTELQTFKRHHFFSTSSDEISTLLNYIVQAKLTETETMLRDKPALLIQRGRLKRFSKELNFTPLQIAVLDNNIEMVEMLERVFEGLDRGREIKAEQFKEIFPNGIGPLARQPFDFTKIARAIGKNSEHDNNNAAYYNHFNPYLDEKMKQFENEFTAFVAGELLFNPAHLHEALIVYRNYYPNWRDDHCLVFWRHVISFVELLLPGSYLQELGYNYGFRSAVYAIKRGETITRPDIAVVEAVMDSEIQVAFHSEGHSDYCNKFYVRDFLDDWEQLIKIREASLHTIQERILAMGPPPAARELNSNERCMIL